MLTFLTQKEFHGESEKSIVPSVGHEKHTEQDGGQMAFEGGGDGGAGSSESS